MLSGRRANALAAIDLLFGVLFGVSFWYWYAHAALLVVFFTLVVVSNVFVWRYARQCGNERKIYDKRWHHAHEALGGVLVFSRALFLGTFVAIVVLQKAGVDVAYTLLHMDVVLLLMICFMGVIVCVEVYLAYELYQQHYKKAISPLTSSSQGASLFDGASTLRLIPCTHAAAECPTASQITKAYWERKQLVSAKLDGVDTTSQSLMLRN